ncbi:hypothetical protein GCM10010411_74090 [Actinomadura fulvescens]|uniref:Deoxyribonuclease NucA/NucB domain-containing protein n=1 Tax=Actinomadura fulvescens TaxID=46160 RepID=A0ABP6CXZ1_9ACTN
MRSPSPRTAAVSVATAAALAAALAAPPALASPHVPAAGVTVADPQPAHRLVIEQEPVRAKPVRVGGRALAVPSCKPGEWKVTRFRGCKAIQGRVLTVAMTVPPMILGVTHFTATHSYQAAANSRTVTDKLTWRTTKTTMRGGRGPGPNLTIKSKCEAPCSATTKFKGGLMRPGKTLTGTITFHDTTPKVHQTQGTYLLIFTSTFALPGTYETPSPQFRCDNLMPGQRAGCVFPGAVPTVTSLAKLKFVGANIRRLQARGAPKVLHRNSWLEDLNRGQVCGRAKLPAGWKPPKGWPRPLSAKLNKPSCDEYAFARTDEGGAKPGNGYGWVPLRENNAQGGLLSGFFKQNRVLDAASILQPGDPFRVKA